MSASKRLPGRPVIGPPFTLRLSVELTAALDRRAAALGISRAALIRALLEHALTTQHNPKE
jgi:predicted transcriptional regulator